MKRILPFLIFALLLSCSQKLFAQNFENPGEYMDYISKQQNNVSKKYMAYTSASAHGKRAKKVENLRNSLMNEVQESKMNINAMPSFQGDKSYRDTAVSFMKLYYNVLNDDYGKIINMEEVAEQSYDAMEAYMMAKDMVDKKMEEANDMMQLVQKSFAASHNVNLIDGKSELGEMMKQVHDMNDYYNVVYLIFFKAYKEEVFLMEAIEKANITGIEQHNNSLLKYANDGLEKLKAIKAFQGDNSIVGTCRNMLNFYVKESGKMTTTSDFFLAKERFETIRKDYEKKSDHNKDDVDAYNKAVNDINKASQAYNNNNNSLNQQRHDALNDWNKSIDQFFDEHTPHYK
ncbi:MAG: hypothetical protein QM737_19165 [Ferruginibacter sp.]